MATTDARPRVVSIPPWRDFAATLARNLLDRFADPAALARVLLILPNRRAARAMTAAFVAGSGDGGVLLPRMVPLGDLDEADGFEAALDPQLPPAVSASERRFLLAAMLARAGMRAPQALHEAATLARALDQLQLWERSAADVAALDVSGFADHWMVTTRRLDAIARAWPALLGARGLIDPAERRVRAGRALAERWRSTGAQRPVIAAGLLNAPPYAAELLGVIARLPDSCVVLPGLDLAMDEAAWDVLDPGTTLGAAHPQASLKTLLDAIGVARAEVEEWSAPADAAARSGAARRTFDRGAFGDGAENQGALAGVRLLEAADPEGEAQGIALAIRHALETPDKTVALVTPDRALARRVTAHLQRYGVEADDSAGQPLGAAPPGAFLKLLLAAAASGFAAVPLLALLKHPLCAVGDRGEHLGAVRALDLALRRQPAPRAGLRAIGSRVPPGHRPWWEAVVTALRNLPARAAALPVIAQGLIAASDALAGEALWTGPAGAAAAELLEAVSADAGGLPPLGRDEAADVLGGLLDEAPVRPAWGGHSRIRILGLIEARLQQAHLLILGGLNEGVWPPAPTPDPWLPPFARRALGLPLAEAQLGLSAHDFLGALGASEVLLTRARRDASAPASPSRFLLRLEAASPGGLSRAHELLAWTSALDATATAEPAARPGPAPPSDVRPRRIAVTAVERLAQDPYAFYAAAILGLRALDPPGADLGPAARGTFVHAALQEWARTTPEDPERIVPIGEALFETHFGADALLRAFWRPRVLRALQWAAEQIGERWADGWRLAAAEIHGELMVGGITLVGKPDRIDVREGRLAITDYKTGALPQNPALAGGFALQLGLLATMAERGAFEGVPPLRPERLDYWKLGGGRTTPGECKNAASPRWGQGGPWTDAPGAAAFAWDTFETLARDYLLGDQPFTARLHPEFQANTDYDVLARVAEWEGR